MIFEGGGFKQLTEENIYKQINEYDIFSYYIPDFEAINKKFTSPFRSDSIPSCSIQDWKGTLYYKDFGTGETFTAINFVKTKFNANYYETLNIISNDFNLGLHSKTMDTSSMGYVGIPNQIRKEIPRESIIRIKRRKWNSDIDRKYWGEQGFNTDVLSHFHIVPLSHVFIGDNCIKIKPNCPSYAYVIDTGVYKILSPFSEEYKWITNCKAEHIQGWNQLPETGELLVITSSLKDVAKLYQYGYSAIAPQSENTLISIDKMTELKNRFKKIVVYFDNDEPGIEAAQLYESLFEVDYIHNPIGDPKDISDYYKMWGDNPTRKLLKELL